MDIYDEDILNFWRALTRYEVAFEASPSIFTGMHEQLMILTFG